MKYLLIGLLSLMIFPAKAQTSNYTKNLEESLYRLSLQHNPDYKVYLDRSEVNRYLLGVKKYNWLNTITFYGNLNELNIGTNSTKIGFSYFPRYNIGILLPLGIFFTSPRQIKSAQSVYLRSIDVINSQKLDLRYSISNNVQKFMELSQEFRFYNEAVINSKTYFLSREKAFLNNTISKTEYNTAKGILYSNLTNFYKRRRDLIICKNDLERLVGIELDSSLKPIN